jgi:hypothetical protein
MTQQNEGAFLRPEPEGEEQDAECPLEQANTARLAVQARHAVKEF